MSRTLRKVCSTAQLSLPFHYTQKWHCGFCGNHFGMLFLFMFLGLFCFVYVKSKSDGSLLQVFQRRYEVEQDCSRCRPMGAYDKVRGEESLLGHFHILVQKQERKPPYQGFSGLVSKLHLYPSSLWCFQVFLIGRERLEGQTGPVTIVKQAIQVGPLTLGWEMGLCLILNTCQKVV